jgi:drug/metabolite transporter (DMT)-like permease
MGKCAFIESMRLPRSGRANTGLSPSVGLLLLSALWAATSLRTELFPAFGTDGLPPVLRQAVLFFVFAAVAGSLSVARRVEFPRGRYAWACAAIGFGLFVVPVGLVAFAQDGLPTLDRVAVFSLTPVFAVVLEPYLQGSGPRQGRAALAGALAAVAGILFLFPLDLPGSFRAVAALCGLVAAALGIAATNCLAVRLAHDLSARSTLPMAAQAGAAAAGCFAAAAALAPHSAWRWSALPFQFLWLFVIDGPALFLLFWLMGRMAASRMTAPFLLAPLFTILAGLALEPSSPPLRGWLGMALLAGGAGWLIFAPAETPEIQDLEPLNAITMDTPRRPPP